MKYKQHTQCRVCNSQDLTKYLDLGMLPLSNNLAKSANDPIHNEKYPLQVMLCENCGLSQLSIVVDPEILFSHYVYRSSISEGYKNHCKEMAEELKLKYNLTDKSFVIDIAGNDGALLNQFKLVLGCKVLNIDPAVNLMRSNFEKDIPIMCKFWDKDIVPYLSEYPMADIITATNVFAHVDNVKEFIEAAKYILNPTGKLILEFPYLIDFINNKEFDTVYFEHLSYFSITPLQLLCSELGLNIEDVSKQNIHGGSVRVTIGYGEVSNNVALFIEEEKKYKSIEVYKEFAKEVKLTIAEFAYKISLLKNVAGFAASAKGNTLLNCSDVHLTYIIDQTDEKIGKFSPGVKTPIYSTDVLDLYQPDYLVILSWNFADEIMNKCRALGYKNKFIIPLPIFKLI